VYGVSHLMPQTPAPGLIAPDTKFVMSLPLQVRESSMLTHLREGGGTEGDNQILMPLKVFLLKKYMHQALLWFL